LATALSGEQPVRQNAIEVTRDRYNGIRLQTRLLVTRGFWSLPVVTSIHPRNQGGADVADSSG
jgi:hypothetical protein